ALMGVLIAFCGLMHVRRQQVLEERKRRPFGHLTEAQITSCTQPLFDLLAPGKTCWMAFTTDTCRRSDGADGHYWDVDCLQTNNPEAEHLVHFQGDADTGALRSVSCPVPERVAKDAHRPITEQQAIEQSWYWLRTLGFAKAGSRWRCAPEP